jgi:hypothetical protein
MPGPGLDPPPPPKVPTPLFAVEPLPVVVPPVSELALGLLFVGLAVMLPCVPPPAPVCVGVQAEEEDVFPSPLLLPPAVAAVLPVIFCCCAMAGWE